MSLDDQQSRSPGLLGSSALLDPLSVTQGIGNFGIANGNQAIVPIQLPVNVCGNAAGVAGNGQASCKGGSQARIGGSKKAKGKPSKGKVRKHGSTDLTSIGNAGILNGNQAYLPIQVPIDVCGNALGLLGNGAASSKGALPLTSAERTLTGPVCPVGSGRTL